MRSGGYGISAFFTKTGLGTLIETGGLITKYHKDGTPELVSKSKPKQVINGEEYILEETLRPDYSFVKGHIADELGNVWFNKAAVNFNKDAAKCGKICIVEVEEIVPAGTLKPEDIHLPHIFVKRIFKGKEWIKPIEKRTTTKADGKVVSTIGGESFKKWDWMCRRAAMEIKDGMYVNLGIGIPTLCSNYLDPSINITFHSENGLLGFGGYP